MAVHSWNQSVICKAGDLDLVFSCPQNVTGSYTLWRLQEGKAREGRGPPVRLLPPRCPLHPTTALSGSLAQLKIVELLYVSIGIWVCTGFDDSDWGIGQWWEWNSNRHVKSTNNMQTVTKTNVMCILTRPCRSQRRSLMRRATDSVYRLSLSRSPHVYSFIRLMGPTGCWASSRTSV